MTDPSLETHWLLRDGDAVHSLRAGLSEIGRSASVAVPIDDQLASRRHAQLDVSATAVRIRDLGSRNGVLVRGAKLAEGQWAQLADADQILIGTTRLVLLKERKRGRKVTAVHRPVPSDVRKEVEGAATGSAAPYETFLSEANRASARGDVDRLVVACELLLDTLGGALHQGLPGDAPAVASAVNHSLFLAGLYGSAWINRIFGLYLAGLIVMPIDVLGRIEALSRERGLPDHETLNAYVSAIRPKLEAQGPRGLALLRQLERVRRLSTPPDGL